MKYKVTVRFSGFVPGEIVDIPDEHDLPQSLFDQGYFEPLEAPKKKKAEVKKEAPSIKTPLPITPSTTTTSNPSTSYITYTNTNGTTTSKPDKLD